MADFTVSITQHLKLTFPGSAVDRRAEAEAGLLRGACGAHRLRPQRAAQRRLGFPLRLWRKGEPVFA